MSAHTKKTKAEKQRIAAKWQSGTFSIVSHGITDSVEEINESNPSSLSDSVIFDQNQVRLLYKDIRTSIIATVFIACLLGGIYAMMRF